MKLSLLLVPALLSLPPAAAQVVTNARTIKATIPSGDVVEIYRHGATVSSWNSSSGEQHIFLSTASVLNGSAALRGGVPIVFPNFGTAPANHSTTQMPSHGFARNSTWEFVGSEATKEDKSLVLTFHLNSRMLIASYQAKWPFSVDLTYTITLSPNNLSANIRVENTDTIPFEFQYLLHAYMSLPVSLLSNLQLAATSQYPAEMAINKNRI
jgi:glucose-6-phosphate 1-epimerase